MKSTLANRDSTNQNTFRKDSNDLLVQNKRKNEIKKLREEIKNLKNQKKSLIQDEKVKVEVLQDKDTLKIYRLTTSPKYSKNPELFLKTIYTKSFHSLERNYNVISCLNIRLINTHSEREEITRYSMAKLKYPILDENDKKTYLNSLPNYFLGIIAHPNLEGSGWRQNGVNFFELKLVKIR